MITPDWEDINKLESQNKQMRVWIEQQGQYIKALQRSIPPALLEDLEPHLPTLPNIPESLDLYVPQRMLKNPVEDIEPLFRFSEIKRKVPEVPPRLPPTPVEETEPVGFPENKKLPLPMAPLRGSSLALRTATHAKFLAQNGESLNHNDQNLNQDIACFSYLCHPDMLQDDDQAGASFY